MEKKKSTRDEFIPSIKRVMAERVAWRCCFPNCDKITIGPQKGDDTKSLNLGEAAHITAAAADGPRYDANLDRAQRRAITNGIWMCRPHARFIDTDYKEYSAATLLIWKKQAEEMAYQHLMMQSDYRPESSVTLIALGTELLFWGSWKSVIDQCWTFEVSSYLKGDAHNVRSYADNFFNLDENQKFIIVESQGDARQITAPLELEFSDSKKVTITIMVSEKTLATPPKSVGMDLKLGEDGDLVFINGDFATVSGVEAAIQAISILAGTLYGELRTDPGAGSYISDYYRQYHHNEALLARLIKIELIRLSLVPRVKSDGECISPPLSFIKEIVSIGMASTTLERSRLTLELSLILGDETRWKGTLRIFIKTTLESPTVSTHG
ncbi:putative lysogenic conversion protein [Cellvibrio sp. BR]|jgi:hypothetical protein|uniref:hypothetical protein n=1 Tax=Cellvibrio sp. BR TaxID=1134474 RepID=UPI0002600965|nr:hypothetical protein [Cellvibrio sp. BR]EIK43185.1 putative lysogenic conversion protein [Cellvibrio sp. BR]